MSQEQKDFLIQYIVIRKDLSEKPYKWGFGSMATQTCHASVAVISENLDDKETKEYIDQKNIPDMRKVILKVETEKDLLDFEKTLVDNKIIYKLWKEQPENINTCIAIKPYWKSHVSHYVKILKLFK